jgi:hypothetical protein
MQDDSDRQAGAETIEVTDEMLAAGLSVWRDWEFSDEPDVRVMVRAILSIALCEHVSSANSRSR